MLRTLKHGHARRHSFAITSLLLVVTCAQYGFGAVQNRSLQKTTHPFEPIEITEIKVRGNTINFDEPLATEKDWLQGLTIRVKNTSGKPISFIGFELRTSPSEPGEKQKVITFSKGTLPLAQNGILQPLQTLVAPDAFVEVMLKDKEFIRYQEDLQVSKLKVSVGSVFFTDDTMWLNGVLFKRDSQDTKKWNPMAPSVKEVEEFLKKKQTLVRPPNVSLRTPSFSLQAVAYRPRHIHKPLKP